MRRFSLAFEVFLAMFLSALLTTLLTGAFAHETLVAVVHAALSSVPGLSDLSEGLLLARAEESIVQGFDASTYLIVFFAVAVAAAAALVVAVRLNRPVRRLVSAVDDFTHGNHGSRTLVGGPAEIASLSSSFNRLADSLEEEDHLRRKLVADISHELRNPITVAMAQTELMLDGVVPCDTEHLRALLVDMQHLEALMDDLHELSVAESGRWSYEMAPMDLAALLVRNAERVEQRVHSGVEVHVAGVAEPVMVYADKLRMEQVIRNILGNAKRHTTSGSITLSLSASPTHATVRIADTGDGIAPENLPHIFERFYRADAARGFDTGGAGLGLSIVRSVIGDHGGEVFAESELGRGTVVGFTLPRYRGDAPGTVARGLGTRS